MSDTARQPDFDAELRLLVASVCDGAMTPGLWERLNELLAGDARARADYILRMDEYAELLWRFRSGGDEKGDSPHLREAFLPQTPSPSSNPEIPKSQNPPIPLPPSFIAGAWHGTVGFFSQEIPFACLVTSIIMSVAGVIGLNITKEHYTQLPWKSMASADRSYAAPESDAADKANAAVKEQKAKVAQWVGQITGKVDCVWANNKTAPVWHKFGMNDKFELKSGLVEITYYTGAKVILQGPCTYEVDSAAGGYLSLGKLTARVEKSKVASGQWLVASEKGERGEGRGESEKAEGGGRKAEETAKTKDQRPKIEGPNSSLTTNHQPLATNLFAVRTPTAVVTDLGTEFGVEVSEKGETHSRVFRGKVAMVAMDGEGNVLGERVVLGEGEMARVTLDRVEFVEVISGQDAKPSDAFVCEMPKRGPLKLFNTGNGLSEGNEDPHWQIVARSDDPNFKPQPAAVSAARAGYVPNDPSRSQWISLAGDDAKLLPDNVVYTFRTTFDLGGFAPNTAFVQVRSLADDCVKTIRLNGKRLSLAEDPGGSFTVFRCDTIRQGFVQGVNTLEFDVLNGDSWNASRQLSPMALRVELEGSCIPLPGGSAGKEGRESSEALRPKSGAGVGSPISSQHQTP